MWILANWYYCCIILNVYIVMISVGHLSGYIPKCIKFVGEVEVVSIDIFLCICLNSVLLILAVRAYKDVHCSCMAVLYYLYLFQSSPNFYKAPG